MHKRVETAALAFLLLLAALLPAGAAGKAQDPEAAYRKALSSYRRLSRSPRLRRYRKSWIRVISGFRKVYLTWPDHPEVAPKCLYMMGRTYRELHGYSGRMADLKEAAERFEVLVERFPGSRLAPVALYDLASVYRRLGRREAAEEALFRIVTDYPGSRYAKRAERRLGRKTLSRLKAARAAMVQVTGVRHWSEKDYTRVVVDATRQVTYIQGYLPQDRKRGLPKRLYLDLRPARLKSGVPREIQVKDGLLRGVRVAQHDRETVRVVFDLGDTSRTRVFHLEDPFRIVVDAFGAKYSARAGCDRRVKGASPKGTEGRPLTLAQQLGLCVKRVVVDAGHGGKDPGAVGPKGLKEKDVTLRIAKRVAERLRALGIEAVLTRRRDRFLPLEERTAIANAKKADLFVSIHCNAAPSRRLRGIETYFLNFALDKEAMRVAARENAVSEKRIGELKRILDKIIKNAKVEESSRLASHIQASLVSELRGRWRGVQDLGVKQAPFFVLIGAGMPSALVEVSFISNPQEERRLRSKAYVEKVAEGIVKGILSYTEETRGGLAVGYGG